jgi:hypothetical protein
MRTRTFVSGLAAAAAAAAFIAGTTVPSAASPRTKTPQAGTQQVVEHAQQSSKRDQVPAIVRRWAAAWTTTDTRDLARL